MTNELSKQICEICGIKPAYKCTYTGNLCPYKYEGNLKPRCPKQAIPKECEVRRKIDYIDFSKPENFVKLMELNVEVELPMGIVDAFLGETITTNVNTRFYDRKSFLELLISELKDTKDPLMSRFKQSIREAEWKYD